MVDSQHEQIIGRSPAFLEVMSKIPQIAESASAVLIVGDTGTGKEVIAKEIHRLSPRKDKPFVPVNCGTIPKELAENELFGHLLGAFTGATNHKQGLIAEAEGGTLFLDEVDGFPLSVQVKLLRFLEEKTYRPLGCTKERQANVRLIAAMNSDPEMAVSSGKLRLDLFYRLNIFSLRLPNLRERIEDIPLLARHFLMNISRSQGITINDLSESAVKKLTAHDWPGNVRELEHAIERAVVFCDSEVIREHDISLDDVKTDEPVVPFQEKKAQKVRQFEIEYIEKLLLAHGGSITKAAATAQKDRKAFSRLISKYGIDVKRFKLVFMLLAACTSQALLRH